MTLPLKLAAPRFPPQACIFCADGYRGGGVLDMLAEHPVMGRMYVCLLHAKLIAIAAGFAEGKELERLTNADELLREAEKGIAERDEMLERITKTMATQDDAIDELTRERDDALGRERQAEEKLRELGQGIAGTLAAVSREEDAGMLRHVDGTPYMNVADYFDTSSGGEEPE